MGFRIGTEILYLKKYKGIIRGQAGGYAVEFPQGAGDLFMHDCAGMVPSGKGRWCYLGDFSVLKPESPFIQSVLDYINKELNNG